jgi:hypothetical protein
VRSRAVATARTDAMPKSRKAWRVWRPSGSA